MPLSDGTHYAINLIVSPPFTICSQQTPIDDIPFHGYEVGKEIFLRILSLASYFTERSNDRAPNNKTSLAALKGCLCLEVNNFETHLSLPLLIGNLDINFY